MNPYEIPAEAGTPWLVHTLARVAGEIAQIEAINAQRHPDFVIAYDNRRWFRRQIEARLARVFAPRSARRVPLPLYVPPSGARARARRSARRAAVKATAGPDEPPARHPGDRRWS